MHRSKSLFHSSSLKRRLPTTPRPVPTEFVAEIGIGPKQVCSLDTVVFSPSSNHQCRFLSVHTHPNRRPATSSSLELWWEESTESLLNDETPLDSLRWHKAETMIVYWADQETAKGLDRCLQLLHRMAEDRSDKNDSDDGTFMLHRYLLHAILSSWKKALSNASGAVLLPSRMLDTLEMLLAKAPHAFEPLNIVSYTMILDGAAACAHPTERVAFSESLLERLMEASATDSSVQPTAFTLGTVMKAWAKSGNLVLAQKAEDLLRRAIQLQESQPQWKDLEINTVLYTSVLGAYASAGAPEPAERLLREMYEESMLHGKTDMQPNLRSFNAVLSAWSQATDVSPTAAYPRAHELFETMQRLHESGQLTEPPDLNSYFSLLKILAQRGQPTDAVDRAHSLIEQLMQDDKANPRESKNSWILQACLQTFQKIIENSHHPDKQAKLQYCQSLLRRGSNRSSGRKPERSYNNRR